MAKVVQVNPFDLLGQAELYPPHITMPGEVTPRLEIAWDSFHQNFFTNMPVFFQRAHLSSALPLTYVLRDTRVEGRFPGKTILAAAAIHAAVLPLLWAGVSLAPERNAALENAELTWSGPIDDLPLVNMPKRKSLEARTRPAPDAPAEGAEAYHPRQRIFSDPAHPNHPRQTLINPAAPPDAPKILPEMPNIVRLGEVAAPPRPHLEISEQALAKLHPKKVKRVATTDTPALDLPNAEPRPAELSILSSTQEGPARPKLEITAGSAPRLSAQKQAGEIASPDVAPAPASAAAGAASTLIALSATPAPPSPSVSVPEGNLAARVAISPEGEKSGAGSGGASGKSGAGGTATPSSGPATGNGVGISVSGGNPKSGTTLSGLGGTGRFSLSKPQALFSRSDMPAASEEHGPPNFAALPPGAPPEKVFGSRRIYALNVNMPNLNSATGSWIIHFSDLRLAGPAAAGELSSPVPVHKVDPKYPSTIMDEEHIEGEVVLYAVIRRNGTVDSIQLVRKLDERLDANAMSAFSQWKFEPATRAGQPVDLEAIVHIPFHRPERQ